MKAKTEEERRALRICTGLIQKRKRRISARIPLQEAMIKSARADIERFWFRKKFGKRMNTGCISSFTNCIVGPKDPIDAEAE